MSTGWLPTCKLYSESCDAGQEPELMALNRMGSLGTWRTSWFPIQNHLHLEDRNITVVLVVETITLTHNLVHGPFEVEHSRSLIIS